MSALQIGLLWFLMIAVITGAVTAFGHYMNGWYFGFLAIDAASAVLLWSALRLGAAQS